MNRFNLNEETISNYKVTKKMKKVWKVELDMLDEFIRVCNKYDLNYFITAGSLLGAIRHGGFIPWDDDIDVGMLREDYDKLLKIADDEFKEPYFFQTSYNDKIFRGHAQLRNSNTTAILPYDINQEFNQGIFMDIFPYDCVPHDEQDYIKHKRKVDRYRKFFQYYYLDAKSLSSRLKKILMTIFVNIYGYKRLYRKFERVCSKYSKMDGLDVTNLSLKYGRSKYEHKKEYFSDLIESKFEYLTVKIPREYDEILSKQYDDYMVCKNIPSTHGEVYLDPDNSYKENIKKLRRDAHAKKV